MARCILIVDSDSGELIDVAGNGREGGRYGKFAKRLLSRDANPVLDYGGNGGDTLVVSKGGGRGKAIRLMADSVVVDGALSVGGKTIPDIVSENSTRFMDDTRGTSGEIKVIRKSVIDQSTQERREIIQIGLADAVVGRLEMIDEAIGKASGFVTKDDLAKAIADLSVGESDTLEDVKGTLRVLLQRLNDLIGSTSSSSSSSDSAEG